VDQRRNQLSLERLTGFPPCRHHVSDAEEYPVSARLSTGFHKTHNASIHGVDDRLD
jgi:hypothetical protein